MKFELIAISTLFLVTLDDVVFHVNAEIRRTSGLPKQGKKVSCCQETGPLFLFIYSKCIYTKLASTWNNFSNIAGGNVK